MSRLYFDHNATSPLLPQARKAMIHAMDMRGNASSIHEDGRRIRQHLEQARQIIADHFSVKSSQVIFTSGATEANNLVLKGYKGPVITSAIEHDSVLKARQDSLICRVTKDGVVDLNHLEELIQQTHSRHGSPALISIMGANNETGVIQPLQEIADLGRKYGSTIHSDAVQITGKCVLDWANINLNYISLSAHKIGGPQGVGALIIDEKLSLSPLITGGGQERYFRSGTENVLGIIGFGAAMDHCLPQNWQKIESLRDLLEETLTKICPETCFYGKSPSQKRLPNTSNIRMPGVKNNIQVINFDLKGISLSAGSACSSGKVKISHVLQAMGITDDQLHESIRVSLGPQTTHDDIDKFVLIWQDLYSRGRKI